MGPCRQLSLSDDNPLMYLPRRGVQQFDKGQCIYESLEGSTHLYAVIFGLVKILKTSAEGNQVFADFVSATEIFGESCLVAGEMKKESAIALDQVVLMAWTRAEIEDRIEVEPRLGLALYRSMVRRSSDLQDRVQALALYKIPERVMLALVHFAARLGNPASGGVRIPSITHQSLAEYLGMSREVVTAQMNRLRTAGMLQYTRKYIEIHVPLIEAELRKQGVNLPQSHLAASNPA